eukprot:5799460-Prymnesium_polylepis.1
MEVEAQVAHFLRLSTAALRRQPEVRARSRASGRWPSALLLPLMPNVLTPVTPPSGRHFCETRPSTTSTRRRDGHKVARWGGLGRAKPSPTRG